MPDKPPIHDTLVYFEDQAGTEYAVPVPRLGHVDWQVRAVAYRWICKQIGEGTIQPHGELRYRSIGSAL